MVDEVETRRAKNMTSWKGVSMGRRILFTSQKGGVGKSTLARSLGVALAEQGRRVLLADFDSFQGTCLRWRDQRAARGISPSLDARAFEKPGKLARAEGRYDDVVIDTAGRLDDLGLTLAREADAIFLPASYSLDDIAPTLRIVARLREEGARAAALAVVFCRTGGSAPQEIQARSILAMNAITVIDPVFPQKDGFAPLYATGRTGREATNPHLRDAASAVDAALLAFVERAGRRERPKDKAVAG